MKTSPRIQIETIEHSPPKAPLWEEPPPPDDRNPVKVKQWWVPFEGVVSAGEESFLGMQVPSIFKGHRLSVDPTIAARFRIIDVRVGTRSQRINGDKGAAATLFPPLPAGLTTEEREDYEALLSIHMDVAQPSQMIGVRVKNVSKEPATFNGLIWGRIVE